MVVAGGGEGITTRELVDALALNMKRNGPRVRELERRFGVKAQSINEVRRGVGMEG